MKIHHDECSAEGQSWQFARIAPIRIAKRGAIYYACSSPERNSDEVLVCQSEKTGEKCGEVLANSFNFQEKLPQEISHKFLLHTSGPQIPQGRESGKNERATTKGQNRFTLFHAFSEFIPQDFPLQNKGF